MHTTHIMADRTRTNESRLTCEWIMPHIWMSPVIHMKDSRHTCEWVTSHIPYEWVTQHLRMHQVTHINKTYPTHTHINKTYPTHNTDSPIVIFAQNRLVIFAQHRYHTCKRVTSLVHMPQVTHINDHTTHITQTAQLLYVPKIDQSYHTCEYVTK